MSTAFVLTTNLLAWNHKEASTRDAFQKARAAVDRLADCLAIEEAFAVLVANYASFEQAVAAANIGNMVDRGMLEADFHNRRREVERHLVNLLATGRMFTEHLTKRTAWTFGEGSAATAAVKAALDEQRDQLFGFRATERLRDAVLHRQLPITSWSSGGRWTGTEMADGSVSKRAPTARLEHSVTFVFSPRLLARDRKVPPEVISGLLDRTDEAGHVDWIPLVREYVEGLSMVLGSVRVLWGNAEATASAYLAELTGSYLAALPEGVTPPAAVFAVEQDDEGRWLSKVLLNRGYEALLADLRRKQGPMVNLHRRTLVEPPRSSARSR